MRLPDPERRGVIARELLDGGQGVAASEFDLAHVRHVEEAGAGAHGPVLIAEPGVLDGHLPAGKRHHAGA